MPLPFEVGEKTLVDIRRLVGEKCIGECRSILWLRGVGLWNYGGSPEKEDFHVLNIVCEILRGYGCGMHSVKKTLSQSEKVKGLEFMAAWCRCRSRSALSYPLNLDLGMGAKSSGASLRLQLSVLPWGVWFPQLLFSVALLAGIMVFWQPVIIAFTFTTACNFLLNSHTNLNMF